MSTDPSVIVAGARTPMGRMSGSLKGFSGSDLGGFAIKGALDKAGVDPADVDYVIMGQVLTAGEGQIPARQAAAKAGIPMTVPALTINKVCLSGIDAIALADQLIRAGEFDVVVAGGQESMTNAPHLLEKSRDGYKYGDVTMHDHMAQDGLWDAFTDQAMGLLTETANTGDLAFTREEQDAFSARSHQLAARAWKDGFFDDEVVTVSIPQRKGEPLEFQTDEGIRADTTTESLGGLRPAFRKDGTITAGSASQISDGACAVVVMQQVEGRGAGPDLARRDRRPRRRRRPRLHAAEPAGPRHRQGLRARGHLARRPRPRRDQRGVRRRRPGLDQGARPRRGQGQRQRRRHRPRPPDRDVRRPHRPPPRARAPAARWRCRCGRPVRRWRPGRRPRHQGPRAGADALSGVRSVDVPSLVSDAREGRPRAVARLISLVEDGHPALRELMAALAPHTGRAHVVGITGPPGVGKSTTTNALVGGLPRARLAGRGARRRPDLAVLGRGAAR